MDLMHELVEAGKSPLQPAGKEELAQRKASLRRFRFVYVSSITILATDPEDAQEEFDNLNLTVQDDKIVDADFYDVTDMYEVDDRGMKKND